MLAGFQFQIIPPLPRLGQHAWRFRHDSGLDVGPDCARGAVELRVRAVLSSCADRSSKVHGVCNRRLQEVARLPEAVTALLVLAPPSARHPCQLANSGRQ